MPDLQDFGIPYQSAPRLMLECYDSNDPDPMDEALDELLCEYVDGTMDPTVRAAFEEYLEANPDLAAHVRCLCETRKLLCNYGCRHTGQTMQAQIRRRVAGELLRKSRTEAAIVNRLGNVALLTSAVGLFLILGMMAGVTAVKQSNVQGSQVIVEGVESLERSVSPVDQGYHNATSRRAFSGQWDPSTGYAFGAPSSVLPTIHTSSMMTPINWSAHTGMRGGFMTVSTP